MRNKRVLSIALLLIALAGCGKRSGLDKVIVNGSVSYQNEPIENGQIRFYPLDGTPGSISGASIKDGKYTAKAKDGVPVCKHEVRIEGYRPQSSADDDLLTAGQGKPRKKPKDPRGQYIPAKYNERSKLVVEVNKDNKIQDFHLE